MTDLNQGAERTKDEADAPDDLRKAVLEGADDEWMLGFIRGYPFARAAPAAAQLDADLPPPNAYEPNGKEPTAYSVNVVRQVVAQYVERIRLLTEELEAARKQVTLQELADIGQEQSEAFAWAVFAENGNVIIWSRRRNQVEPVAAKYGRPIVPVIAYINGRTAVPAVPEGQKLVPVEPTVDMIAAMHFKGDVDIALGHAQFYKEATEDYAAMLAAAPSPLSGTEDAQ